MCLNRSLAKKVVLNQKVLKPILCFCGIISVCASKGYSNNSNYENRISEINITNVMNISNFISSPIKLEVNEEINIELIRTETEDQNNIKSTNDIFSSNSQRDPNPNKAKYNNGTVAANYHKPEDRQRPNRTTYNIGNFKHVSAANYQENQAHQSQNKTTCCLVIYPPKCDINHCIIRRKKMCWNVCTEEIVLLESPGFPKDKIPTAFIPSNWKNGQFSENLTVSLGPTHSTKTSNELSSSTDQQPSHYWSQVPHGYLTPQNLASQQNQNINPNSIYNVMPYQIGNPYFSPYTQPKPPVYWCPGPYCPLFMPHY